jgi:hypothetical protein
MRDVTQLVAQVREELTGELRERVRDRLLEQPTEWLVEQLMTLVLRGDEVTYSIPRQVPRGPAAEQGLYGAPASDAGDDRNAHKGEGAPASQEGESRSDGVSASQDGESARPVQEGESTPPGEELGP